MEIKYRVLEDDGTVRETDFEEYREWRKEEKVVRIGSDLVINPTDNCMYWVSTVFNGLAPGYNFETMVFPVSADGDPIFTDVYCSRYITKHHSEDGHKTVCRKLSQGELDIR